jgi:anaerobic magnesium-protoporphyrin IX monomethyl ester cyclase
MNIVLVTVPIPEIPWNTGSFPPLGLLYLAGGVKPLTKVKVSLVDAFCEGLNVRQSVERILSSSPDLVGLSMASRNLKEAASLLADLKSIRPELLTLAGGIHPTLFDHLLIKEIPSLDLVLRGEADESFPELCRRLLAGQEISGVPGLSYRARGKVRRGEPQFIEDLDTLPFPDRSLLDPNIYGTQWYGFNLPILPRFTTAFSSRGCLFNCTFCAGVKLCQNRLRTRSAENVLAELVSLSQEGFEFVIFFDDNFTGEAARVDKLCHLIIEHHLKLSLAFAGTLHHLPDATLHLMHQAGFDLVFVGVESGSDAQLRRYRKPSTSQVLATDILRAKNANMITIASFITGSKWEAESDHEATKDFVWKVRPHLCEINPLMAHPGSHLWEEIHAGQDPQTLEESESRLVSRFPGQMPKALIKFRERDFRRTFRRSWLHWRRIVELLDLFAHNQLFARLFKTLLTRPLPLLKLYYWGRKRE